MKTRLHCGADELKRLDADNDDQDGSADQCNSSASLGQSSDDRRRVECSMSAASIDSGTSNQGEAVIFEHGQNTHFGTFIK